MSLIVADNNQFQTKSLLNLSYLYYQRTCIKPDLSLTLRGPENH